MKLISIILILLLGIIVYANSFHCSFHFDDHVFIIDNPAIKNIHDVPSIWGYYPGRFIIFLSLALNYYLNHLDVFGYHIFNLGVHIISAILVWWLMLLTLSSPVMKNEKIAQHANLLALCVGLVFVCHPLQTEAVTFIWQRAASLTTMFYLLSLCLYIQSRLLNNNLFYYLCALISTILLMFTKEICVTMPLILVVYEIFFLKDKEKLAWRRVFPFLLTLLIIPLTMLLNNSLKVAHIQGSPELNITPYQYALTQIRVMFTYIRLAFFPFNQNFDYDYPIFNSIFEFPIFLSLFSLILIACIVKWISPRYKIIAFSIIWFFLCLMPEAVPFPVKDLIFEHRLYLPLIGYSIFLVSSMYYLFENRSFKITVMLLLAIIMGYSFLTFQRNKVWKDDLTLWGDVIQKSPHKERAYDNLGFYYANQGNILKAFEEFNKVIEINPKSSLAYYNRGVCYDKLGKLKQAISDYIKVIEIKPDYAESYYSRGFCYDRLNNYTRAIIDYTHAIEINAKYTDAYNNRGALYGSHGKYTQAIADFTKAIEIDPNNTTAFMNRSIIYYQLKFYDKAWEDVIKVRKMGGTIDPKFILALFQASGKKI